MSAKQYSPIEQAVGGISLAILAIFVFLIIKDRIANKLSDGGQSTAHSQCIKAIENRFGPQQSVSIPYTKNIGGDSEFHFAWPPGSGLQVDGIPKSATCVVWKTTMEITILTINGRDMIWKAPP